MNYNYIQICISKSSQQINDIYPNRSVIKEVLYNWNKIIIKKRDQTFNNIMIKHFNDKRCNKNSNST